LKQVYHDEWDYLKEEYKDMACAGLRKVLEDEQAWAIKFVLTTLGKDERFSEQTEIRGPDGAPFRLTVNIITDESPVKDEE
jgi:hypothetical protein